MADFKLEKRVKSMENELGTLFHSITRYNPPNVTKIDPRFASFEDLPPSVIEPLHQLLESLPAP
jgi:hypothetical protein